MCARVCMCACACLCMCVHACVHMCLFRHAHVCMHACVSVRLHVHMHIESKKEAILSTIPIIFTFSNFTIAVRHNCLRNQFFMDLANPMNMRKRGGIIGKQTHMRIYMFMRTSTFPEIMRRVCKTITNNKQKNLLIQYNDFIGPFGLIVPSDVTCLLSAKPVRRLK